MISYVHVLLRSFHRGYFTHFPPIKYMFFNIALNYLETGIVSVLASVEPVAAMVSTVKIGRAF